jgi:Cu2+-exporting ATPase
MFVTFLLAGRWLERRARERVTQSLEALCVRLPEAVDRVVGGADDVSAAQTESVPISSLRHGDRVRVVVGQAFPADGQVLQGQTEVDESLLTGESRAVPRGPGQMVVAGSLNLNAPVWISIERLGPDTRYQQIVSLVQQAMTEKPGILRLADRLAAPFLWGVLLLALLGGVAWYFIDPSRALWVAVSVLVVTCPCAFSISAPAALLAAAGNMASKGVLVRRLDALEALAHVDRVYFDKTGTLTEGQLILAGWRTAQGLEQVHGAKGRWHAQWPQAVDLAAQSQHPLSRSLVSESRRVSHGLARAGRMSPSMPGRASRPWTTWAASGVWGDRTGSWPVTRPRGCSCTRTLGSGWPPIHWMAICCPTRRWALCSTSASGMRRVPPWRGFSA